MFNPIDIKKPYVIMNFNTRNLTRLSQKAIAPFLTFAVVGYFIYHSTQGERGILAWIHLQDRLHQAQQQLDQTVNYRKILEEKVKGLRPESLNRDLLDQQVRLLLGYTHPDEIVILKLGDPSKETNDSLITPRESKQYDDF